LVLNDVPNYRQFNTKVGVSQDIAKGGDIPPGNVRVFGCHLAQVGILEALANDFEIPEGGILSLLIVKKTAWTFPCVFDDSCAAISCMGEIYIRIFLAHRGMASERMRLAR